MNWNLAMGRNNQRSLTFKIGRVWRTEIWPFGRTIFFPLKKPEETVQWWRLLENHQVVSAKNRQRGNFHVDFCERIFVQNLTCWKKCSCSDSMVGLGWDFSGLLKLLMHWKQAIWSTNNWDLLLLRIQTKKSFPPIPHQQPKSADTWKKYGNFSKDDLPQFFLGGASLGCLKRFAV